MRRIQSNNKHKTSFVYRICIESKSEALYERASQYPEGVRIE